MPIDPDLDEALERFAGLVEASPHNLVSRTARAELRTRHIPECLALADLLPAGAARLLDVGAGGGFPGLVIALARPELEVHLLDATRKKTAFLEGAAAALQVEVSVHTGRAEELATGPLRQRFDLVTARAVAPLDRLLPWTIPFLRVGGLLYAVKGRRWAEELDAATPVLRRVGASVVATPDDGPAGATQPQVIVLARTDGTRRDG